MLTQCAPVRFHSEQITSGLSVTHKVDLFNSCVLLWFTYGKDTIGFSYVFEDLWGIASLGLLVPSPQWH